MSTQELAEGAKYEGGGVDRAETQGLEAISWP